MATRLGKTRSELLNSVQDSAELSELIAFYAIQGEPVGNVEDDLKRMFSKPKRDPDQVHTRPFR